MVSRHLYFDIAAISLWVTTTGVVVTIVAVWCDKQGIAGSSLYITRELQDEIGFTVEHLN